MNCLSSTDYQSWPPTTCEFHWLLSSTVYWTWPPTKDEFHWLSTSGDHVSSVNGKWKF